MTELDKYRLTRVVFTLLTVHQESLTRLLLVEIRLSIMRHLKLKAEKIQQCSPKIEPDTVF